MERSKKRTSILSRKGEKYKMSKSWKKKLAATAAAGVFALALAPLTAFGAGALTADSTLTITGLDDGDQVSLYRILELDSAEHGGDWKFVSALDAEAYGAEGYGTLDGTNIKVSDLRAGANDTAHDDFKVITAAMANDIAAQVSSKISTADKTATAANGGKIVVDLRDGLNDDDPTPVGLYMAVVTQPAKTDIVYKPIFISADYDKDDINGEIPAYGTYPAHDNTNAIEIKENIKDGDDGTDYKDNAGVFKKSKLTLEKQAGDKNDRLMDAAVGQVVPFTITTNMPSYTKSFESPVFKITDELTTGLELCDASGDAAVATDISVEVDGYTLTENDYTVTLNGNNKFVVEFKNDDASKTGAKDGILYTVLGNPKVTITYNAKVTNANAAAQVNQMDNNVRLDFTNNPKDTTGAGTLKDRTRHYTFGIDANVLGSGNTGPDGETTTSEIRKIAVDANGEPIYETTTNTVKDKGESEKPDVYNWLEGATFKLMQTHAWKDADLDNTDAGYGMTTPGFVELASGATEITFDRNNIAGGDKQPASDATGHIAMKGLDAGIYELTEVSAPLGYSFDPSMKYIITITPSFTDDNEQDPTFTSKPNKILSGYKVDVAVKQGNETKATASTTYTSETAGSPATPVSFIDEKSADDASIENPTGTIKTTDTTSETALIMNKQLGLLPATGGSGIYFYVGIGVLIMALAVGLGMLRRRAQRRAMGA